MPRGRRGHGLAALARVALIAAALTSCGRSARAPEPSNAERARTYLESGNDAYRAGDFALAARRYAAASALDPDEPACYVGLGMALGRLHRSEEARAAFAYARRLAARRDSAKGLTPK